MSTALKRQETSSFWVKPGNRCLPWMVKDWERGLSPPASPFLSYRRAGLREPGPGRESCNGPRCCGRSRLRESRGRKWSVDEREGSHLKQKELKRKQLKKTEERLLLAINGQGGAAETRLICTSYNTCGRNLALWLRGCVPLPGQSSGPHLLTPLDLRHPL